MTGPTRQEWLLPLFQELGFDNLSAAPGFELSGKPYPISHLWESTPIHLVGAGVELDRRTPGVAGAASASPHGLMQEFLNRSDDFMWGIVSNGREVRILRDNSSLTRVSYVEFDLREMFDGEVFSDFTLLWLVGHASRLEGPPGKQVLERWREDAARQGVRALDALRDGVETAIVTLGTALVGHPANGDLRRRLEERTLDAQELYRQILRVVYRLLFLLVAESRDLLLDPKADQATRLRYQRYYSITRLRDLAEVTRGGPNTDLWTQLGVVARALEFKGEPALGLMPLGGFLWSEEATNALGGSRLPNEAVLTAVRCLTTVRPTGALMQRVDYNNLGAEELGSIYESLLEYVPQVNLVAGSFELVGAVGNERKTTGSYYTPTSLIEELLNSALDPVLEEAASNPDPERAVLDLKVVDPAAGSGHFLIAAAHRIANRLARIRAGEDEPSPDVLRSALRDVVAHCIYAVDINPMAVELAKVALWIEAMEPGKPLTFLDHHIVCGNSLLGVTPKLLEGGIPDEAFVALTGDDKEYVKALKKRNRGEHKKQLVAFTFGDSPDEMLRRAATEVAIIDDLADDSIEAVAEKRRRFGKYQRSEEQRQLRLAADAWVAAFVGPKKKGSPQITASVLNAGLRDPASINAALADEIVAIATDHGFLHWHLAFPDVFTSGETEPNNASGWASGFDIVLGNPPWEKVEFSEQEYFASRDPSIAAAPGARRKSMIRALQSDNPLLWDRYRSAQRAVESERHFIANSNRYPLCGRGRINTYAVFAEAMRSIIGPTGRAGLVVPTGIATDDTTKRFFADLVQQRSLVSLFDFENRKQFFASVHSSYKFCLLTLTGSNRKVEEAEFCFFALDTVDLTDADRRFTLTPNDFALLNPNTRTSPIFRTRRDAELTKRIYERIPILVDESLAGGGSWGINFKQGLFNMTSDSHLFRTWEQLESDGWTLVGNVFERNDLRYLPLYEAKMTGSLDHRSADVVVGTALVRQGQPSALTEAEKRDPTRLPLPRYWVHESEVVERAPTIAKHGWGGSFRDLTSPTNERTFIPALLPLAGVGHTQALIDGGQRGALPYLVGCMASFVFDYVSRQKIGGIHLTFFIVQQLPTPSPAMYGQAALWQVETSLGDWLVPRMVELSCHGVDMLNLAHELGFDGIFRWDGHRRKMLFAELDAAFFHLYGVERDDVDYVMETFPIVKKKDIAEHGSYRTKELILDVYDRMAMAIETGKPYETILNPPPADASLCHAVLTKTPTT